MATRSPEAEALERLIGFGRELRHRGLNVGTGRIVTFCRAAAALGALDREELYWAGRASLISRPEDVEAFAIASDAYIYGYPLVTMEMTRRVVTNVAAPVGSRGPMGTIIKLRQYPDAKFRDVTAPNADTLYTTAFFDVGELVRINADLHPGPDDPENPRR